MYGSRIIVALDFNQEAAALNFVGRLTPGSCRVKVGKELFTAYGPSIVNKLQQRGFEVFLDLKFHDIPHTVYRAIRVAADLGVWMVNVHASGGTSMLNAAREAIHDSVHKPLLIAVTILTSLSAAEVASIGYQRSLEEQVMYLAQMSHACGLDGVVCSAQEAALIKAATDATFLTVTPGIRLSNEQQTQSRAAVHVAYVAQDDQQRIMTPKSAIANGADYLVIGRPLTGAADPLQVLMQIKAQINE